MFKKMKVRRRVRRGAKLLDQERPGWAKKINPDELDLSSDAMCIVGQTFGSHSIGIVHLGVESDDERYGFDISDVDGDTYPELDEAWLKEINKRTGKGS